jgi:tRNA nucleotidyltransferase (CCA-adding enzyme)
MNLGPAAVPAAVLDLLLRLRDAGHPSFLAGGCVRDLLRGAGAADWDVATPALPRDVMRLFPRAVPTGIEHGTVTVPTGAGNVEVTTFRGEGAYEDGRRPSSVTFLDSIEKDLARRDLTINAMAWDPLANDLRDPYRGREDLAGGTVRAVGDAIARFREDGLRPMRAVRFAATLGFVLERKTRHAIPAAADVFSRVARERVRVELEKILVAGKPPSRGLELLRLTALLPLFAPELMECVRHPQNRWHRWDVWRHTLIATDRVPADLDLRLAALFHDVAKPATATRDETTGDLTFHRHDAVGAEIAAAVLDRLRFPARTRDRVAHLIAEHLWHYDPVWTDGTVRRHLARVGPEDWDALLELRRADVLARGRYVREGLQNIADLRARVDAMRAKDAVLKVKDLAVGGEDVMNALGTGAGPRVGEALRWLLEKVMDDPALNTRERLVDLLHNFPTQGAG